MVPVYYLAAYLIAIVEFDGLIIFWGIHLFRVLTWGGLSLLGWHRRGVRWKIKHLQLIHEIIRKARFLFRDPFNAIPTSGGLRWTSP